MGNKMKVHWKESRQGKRLHKWNMNHNIKMSLHVKQWSARSSRLYTLLICNFFKRLELEVHKGSDSIVIACFHGVRSLQIQNPCVSLPPKSQPKPMGWTCFFLFKNEPKQCLITSKFMKFTKNKLQEFRWRTRNVLC
jgi:hypothetical protein